MYLWAHSIKMRKKWKKRVGIILNEIHSWDFEWIYIYNTAKAVVYTFPYYAFYFFTHFLSLLSKCHQVHCNRYACRIISAYHYSKRRHWIRNGLNFFIHRFRAVDRPFFISVFIPSMNEKIWWLKYFQHIRLDKYKYIANFIFLIKNMSAFSSASSKSIALVGNKFKRNRDWTENQHKVCSLQ